MLDLKLKYLVVALLWMASSALPDDGTISVNSNKAFTIVVMSESLAEPTDVARVASLKRVPDVRDRPWEKDYRLPADVLPVHYRLSLHPDLETGLFTGSVDIFVNTTRGRDCFIVHAKYLSVESTKLRDGHDADGAVLPVKDAFEYEPNEFWVVDVGYPVPPGEYTLSLTFSGSLTRDIVGFYKSVYYTDDKKARSIATSKFEPTYARRAFPCFDEPNFKSTFSISLVRPKGDSYVAYSNMPEQSSRDDFPSAGLTTVFFEKSVPMVTYLACFIVCDFSERAALTQRGVPIRAIARADQYVGTEYPLDIGVRVTDYYEAYFGIPYALPKQDLIAIPDFVSGAMEHWGLVTFRETALLFNPVESSSSNQKRVATVVAHELAHQWFGNLMTISWWDDLWLNEGFASYMEYKGVNACHPDWEIETQMLNDDLQVVMKLDAKLSSHPIVQPVNHPDEITEIFDTISYSKGSSVLRMLESFMCPSNFQQGIRNFLTKYEFANAATPDLWRQLQEVTPDLNISRIMDTWTRQMGYPVLNFARDANRRLVVRQSRFLVDPQNRNQYKDTPSPFGYKWDVPIAYVTDRSSDVESTWLYMESDSVTLDVAADVSWIKLNVGQNGFYRVNYLAEHWATLARVLKSDNNVLSAADRWGIMDDAFSLAGAGSLAYDTAFDLAGYLEDERHPVPWISAADKFTEIYSLVYPTHLYPGFRKFIISLVEKPFTKLGWDDQGSFLDKSLRSTILTLACMSDYGPCLDGAAERFKDWIDRDTYLVPNLRSLVYRFGMSKIGDANMWNTMWQRYVNQTDPQESIKLLYGLAFPSEPWLIYQYLEYAKQEKYVRSQDYFSILEFIAENPVGLPIVWDFVRTEWGYLVDRFTTNNRYLGRMVNRVTSHFTTQLRLDEMEDFFAKNPDAGAGARARQEALENVKNNIRWLSDYKQTLAQWLVNHGFSE